MYLFNLKDNTPESGLITGAALAMALIALSFAAIFIRLSEAPALVIAFYRLLFTFGLLFPYSLFMRWKEILSLKPGDLTGMAASGAFLAAHFYLWIASLAYAPVSVSVILVSLHPLLVAAAGHFIPGEPIPRRFLPSVALVLAGTAAMASESLPGIREGSLSDWRGGLMALGGAVMMAGYLLIGRRLRRKLSTPVYAGGTYGAAAAFLLAAAFLAGIPLQGYPPREYMLFAALALAPTLLGHTLFNWALKKVGASLVSMLFLGEPLGATFLAFIILREAPSPLQILGGLIILAGLYLVVSSGRPLKDNRSENRPTEPR